MSARFSLIVLVLMIASAAPLKAQRQHNPKDQIKSSNWDIIGDIEFRLTEDNKIYPIYSPRVKRLANKDFLLEGYIIPIKNGMKHSSFMFSTLPINQCYFCGQNGVPIMILVEMQEPVKFTSKPVTLQGTLILENKDSSEVPPVILRDAKVITGT